MDYKKTTADLTTTTRDLRDLDNKTGNIYESIAIISKRARQISSDLKWEIQRKLEEFAVSTDTIEEVQENKEQIEISKFYERLPKPTTTALEEFLEGKVMYRRRTEEPKTEA